MKILIEIKFYSGLNEKQQELFENYPAKKRIVIDSIEKLDVLYELKFDRVG